MNELSTDSEKRRGQQISEWSHLWALGERYSEFPPGCIEEADSPAPDFIVHQPDGIRIGIEVTRIFRKPRESGDINLREQETLRQRVVHQAREAYDNDGHPPLSVALAWNGNAKLNRGRASVVAAELAAAVAAKIPLIGNNICIDATDGWPPPLPDEVAVVNIYRLQPPINSWRNLEGDYVPIWSPEQIQDVLEEKAPKIPRYREKCDRIWLLIVQEGPLLLRLVRLSKMFFSMCL